MVSNIVMWLVVLFAICTFVAWRMVRQAQKADAADPFLPRLPREFDFERECDAHYPRIGD